MGHSGFFGMGWMWIWPFVLLVLVLFIALAAFIVFRSVPHGGSRGTDETPQEILKRRYARGEISRDEYERMKRDLET